jgi:predicted small secreted protein
MKRRNLLAAALILAAVSLACVTVQDPGRSQSQPGQSGASKQPPAQPATARPQQEDSGFTVGETAVPSTPTPGTASQDGFTVGETAVPDK